MNVLDWNCSLFTQENVCLLKANPKLTVVSSTDFHWLPESLISQHQVWFLSRWRMLTTLWQRTWTKVIDMKSNTYFVGNSLPYKGRLLCTKHRTYPKRSNKLNTSQMALPILKYLSMASNAEGMRRRPPKPRTHLSKCQFRGTNVRWSAYRDENKDCEQWEGRMRSLKLVENISAMSLWWRSRTKLLAKAYGDFTRNIEHQHKRSFFGHREARPTTLQVSPHSKAPISTLNPRLSKLTSRSHRLQIPSFKVKN